MSPDESHDHISRCDDSCTDNWDNAPDSAGLGKVILRSHIMIAAYAVSLVILSLGFVVLILGLTVMCFREPDKANAFLLLLSGPVVGVLLSQIGNIKKISNGSISGQRSKFKDKP
jgi:hypothetical protein